MPFNRLTKNEAQYIIWLQTKLQSILQTGQINYRGCIKMASGSRTRTASTHLECPECNNVVTIHRKKSKMKSKNHTKHLWCFKCKKMTGHIEVKDEAFLPDWLKDREA